MYKLSDWDISDDGFSADDVLQNGNRLLTGNGCLGRRGTVAEADTRDMPATIVAGLYDQKGDLWREPVNAPDPLYTLVSIDGQPLKAGSESLKHEQALNFRYGIYSRRTTWRAGSGTVTIREQRYVHMTDAHLLCLRYTISSDVPVNLVIKQGISRAIRDLNGPHLGNFTYAPTENNSPTRRMVGLNCATLRQEIPLAVFSAVVPAADNTLVPQPETAGDDGIFHHFTATLSAAAELEFFVYGAVYSGLDGKAPASSAEAQILMAVNEGWEGLLKRHRAQWDSVWQKGDVVIEGDAYAQQCLRYSLYHLWIIAPRHSAKGGRALSVPARGLSGQTYKGAVFWDTEMFIAPYFRAAGPELAAQFIRYRIQTLSGAKRKAAEYGCRGAFFAWESQETGDDACSDFNVTDVFTGRPVRTYFRDKQIHISADIVYSIEQYVEQTGDIAILTDGAMELILESARFFLSYLYYSPERSCYEALDVIGPDEYHERVNNNAFTNKMIFAVFEIAQKYINLFHEKNSAFIDDLINRLSFNADLDFMKMVMERFRLPRPDKRGVIEQFDGYFRLEDCTLETVRSRLKDPREYWGCSGGVAASTQIIKQADVVAMLALFSGDYSAEVKKTNLDFYEPRTEHGSSLSSCMYALLSCETGNSDWAYPFFIKSAEIDITGKSKHFAGLIYIGGTHPAANGGAWLTAIHGFCGFSVKNGEITIIPRLPSAWTKVTFSAMVRGIEYTITVTRDGYTICKK